jgi:ABC-type phosphate/phosphonate transport system substrate-binding protein
MTGRVSLPMYDLPGLQPVWDAWWRGMCRAVADAGVGGLDDELTRLSDHMAHWREPGMRLSQTCGYPFTFGLDRDWRLVATPVFAVDWCAGPRYRNLVLARQDDAAGRLEDLKGRRVAFNSEDSHSGYNSIRWMIAPLAEKGRFFGASVQSGSHLASIKALAAGEVDCCSVDCVTFALIAKHGIVPTDRLRVLAEGPLVPGLPFITPRSTPDEAVEEMRMSLMAAAAKPGMAALNGKLLFDGFAAIPASEYKVIAEMDAAAADQGYPALL